MKFTFSFALVFGLAFLDSADGQTVTAQEDTPMNVATMLLKPSKTGMTILSAAASIGEEDQFGTYMKTSQIFPGLANRGAILSSGGVSNIEVGGSDDDANLAGDEDLEKLLIGTYKTSDAASLVVTVLVTNPVTVTFSYVFGSNDYHGGFSRYPDLFAFFLNGVNQAKVGGTAVSTSTVNCGETGDGVGPNCDQLVSNDDGPEVFTSMDAYTKTQTMVVAFPAGTHTIKLSVADADTQFGPNDDVDAEDDAYVLMSFKSAVITPPAPAPVAQMMGMGMMGMMAAR
jgi:hypothetical protein